MSTAVGQSDRSTPLHAEGLRCGLRRRLESARHAGILQQELPQSTIRERKANRQLNFLLKLIGFEF